MKKNISEAIGSRWITDIHKYFLPVPDKSFSSCDWDLRDKYAGTSAYNRLIIHYHMMIDTAIMMTNDISGF